MTFRLTLSGLAQFSTSLLAGLCLGSVVNPAFADSSYEQNIDTPAVQNATGAVREVLKPRPFLNPRAPSVNPFNNIKPGSIGQRIAKSPGTCTPKANSLDCANGEGQDKGADVSNRVRGGVIGEVGSGRAVTQGGGGAQRQEACTPEPGKLTCTP